MVLYLRNNRNETIVDIELYKEDNHVELHSVVCIDTYSVLLLESLQSGDIEKTKKIIVNFTGLQELRGWLWEVYFMGRQNTIEEYPMVLQELRTLLNKIATEYDLNYVED